MLADLLEPVKQAAGERLKSFAATPWGRFVRASGRQVIACEVEGRPLGFSDLKIAADAAAQAHSEPDPEHET